MPQPSIFDRQFIVTYKEDDELKYAVIDLKADDFGLPDLPQNYTIWEKTDLNLKALADQQRDINRLKG